MICYLVRFALLGHSQVSKASTHLILDYIASTLGTRAEHGRCPLCSGSTILRGIVSIWNNLTVKWSGYLALVMNTHHGLVVPDITEMGITTDSAFSKRGRQ